MINLAKIVRHHRSLIWNADNGLLIWEIARKSPEGITCGLCRTENGLRILQQYENTLGELDKPILKNNQQNAQIEKLTPEKLKMILDDLKNQDVIFDRIFFVDPFANLGGINSLCESLAQIHQEEYFAPNWQVVISQKIPSKGQKISNLIKEQILINFNVDEETLKIVEQMQNIEQEFFTDKENPLFNWNQETIQKTFEEKNLQVQTLTQKFKEKRKITSQEIQTWFSSNSAYGANLQTKLGVENLQKIINLLEKAAPETIFDWQNEISFFVICPNA